MNATKVSEQSLRALEMLSMTHANEGCSMTDDLHVICPGLSMWHDHHHEEQETEEQQRNGPSKQDAEQHAVDLLSRPVSSRESEEMPRLLLWNLYSSFATLVESRLHAYTSFLARHGIASSKLGAISDKILTILSLGENIQSERLTSRFRPLDNNALSFETDLDLSISLPNGTKKMLRVTLTTDGGVDSDTDERTTITLNVANLLKDMMDEAAKVVTLVVELASSSSDDRKSLKRSRSNVSATLTQERTKSDLQMLSQAAAVGLPVVSPNIGAAGTPPILTVPSLDLHDDHSNVEDLSADQCADIVDTCLGGIPSRKRTRAS